MPLSESSAAWLILECSPKFCASRVGRDMAKMEGRRDGELGRIVKPCFKERPEAVQCVNGHESVEIPLVCAKKPRSLSEEL